MFFQICLRDATLCYITLHHVTFWRLTGPPAAFSVLRAMSPWRICLHWSNWSSRRRAPISLEKCGDELQKLRRMPFGGDQNEARKSSLGASTTGATKLPINVSRVRSEARFRPATWHRRRKADLCALKSWHGLERPHFLYCGPCRHEASVCAGATGAIEGARRSHWHYFGKSWTSKIRMQELVPLILHAFAWDERRIQVGDIRKWSRDVSLRSSMACASTK